MRKRRKARIHKVSAHEELGWAFGKRALVGGSCVRVETLGMRMAEIAGHLEAIESKKKDWLGIFAHYPSSILSGSVELARMFTVPTFDAVVQRVLCRDH